MKTYFEENFTRIYALCDKMYGEYKCHKSYLRACSSKLAHTRIDCGPIMTKENAYPATLQMRQFLITNKKYMKKQIKISYIESYVDKT